MQIQLYRYTEMGNRVENEDTAACGQLGGGGAYAIVADGLGGHGGGRLASEAAVGALLGCRNSVSLPGREEILGWMEQANREILAKRNGPNHMKTTAVFLAVADGQAVWAHIGDSRLYHYYNGELAELTEDHSVCQMAVKLGEITRSQIPGHPDRSRLLKVLGDEMAEPEVHEAITLQAGRHAFLLCTDGLWERLWEDEILLDLHKADSPGQWVENLRIRAARRKNTDVDNNTAVSVFIDIS